MPLSSRRVFMGPDSVVLDKKDATQNLTKNSLAIWEHTLLRRE